MSDADSTMIPLVSVALATYNGANFLRLQLDSIYAQTYGNIEVIVCDDGSTDETIEILGEYAQKKGLKLHLNDRNLGYVRNFEKAISLCSGEYICLSDQDDVWLDRKIELLVANIGDNLCVHSDASLIDELGQVFASSFSEYSKKLVNPDSLFDHAFNGCVTGCTSMFSRKLLNHVLPIPAEVDVHDRWIGAVAFSQGALRYLDMPLIQYRQHGRNNIGSVNVSQPVMPRIYGFLRKKKSGFFSENKAVAAVYAKHRQFMGVMLEHLGGHLAPRERKKIFAAMRIYGHFAESRFALFSFFAFLRFFPVIEKGKPLKYKIIFLGFLLKDLLFRAVGR